MESDRDGSYKMRKQKKGGRERGKVMREGEKEARRKERREPKEGRKEERKKERKKGKKEERNKGRNRLTDIKNKLVITNGEKAVRRDKVG